ncbi:MAG: S1C family serine protease [Pyrinomonadaceae bacterium]
MMERTIKIALLFGLLFNLPCLEARAQTNRQTKKPSTKPVKSNDLTAEQIAKKYLPSVVLVVCDDGKGAISQGSGFFVRPGEILTNYHVIEGMVRGKAKIAFGGKEAKEWWIRRVLYTDSKNDLALLSIAETPEPIDLDEVDFSKPVQPKKGEKHLPVVDLSGAEVVEVEKFPPALGLSVSNGVTIGQTIYVLSNPEGLRGSISKGIVSSGIRSIKGIDMLQVDAPISAGSSGGAVLNTYGEVIGIATGSLTSGQNLNFAVPAPTIHTFLSGFDSKKSSLHYPAKSSVAESWESSPELGSSEKNVKDKMSSNSKEGDISKMTYDELVVDLTNALGNSKFKFPGKAAYTLMITSLRFSGCNMAITRTDSLDGAVFPHRYLLPLKTVKDFSFISADRSVISSINIELSSGVLEEQGGVLLEEPYEATLVREFSVPVTTDSLEAMRLMIKLKRLAKICSISPDDRPSLKTSTDWLTDRIEGMSYISKELTYKYSSLKFSQCNMALRYSTQGEIEVARTQETDLRFLRKVEVTKNGYGDWGIWLEFSRNFDVTTETFGYFGKKEYGKRDKITIFFDSYERAKRAGSAFARVLELCGEETKEPF